MTDSQVNGVPRAERRRKAKEQKQLDEYKAQLQECLDQLRQALPHETDPAELQKGYAMMRRLERVLEVEN